MEVVTLRKPRARWNIGGGSVGVTLIYADPRAGEDGEYQVSGGLDEAEAFVTQHMLRLAKDAKRAPYLTEADVTEFTYGEAERGEALLRLHTRSASVGVGQPTHSAAAKPTLQLPVLSQPSAAMTDAASDSTGFTSSQPPLSPGTAIAVQQVEALLLPAGVGGQLSPSDAQVHMSALVTIHGPLRMQRAMALCRARQQLAQSKALGAGHLQPTLPDTAATTSVQLAAAPLQLAAASTTVAPVPEAALPASASTQAYKRQRAVLENGITTVERVFAPQLTAPEPVQSLSSSSSAAYAPKPVSLPSGAPTKFTVESVTTANHIGSAAARAASTDAVEDTTAVFSSENEGEPQWQDQHQDIVLHDATLTASAGMHKRNLELEWIRRNADWFGSPLAEQCLQLPFTTAEAAAGEISVTQLLGSTGATGPTAAAGVRVRSSVVRYGETNEQEEEEDEDEAAVKRGKRKRGAGVHQRPSGGRRSGMMSTGSSSRHGRAFEPEAVPTIDGGEPPAWVPRGSKSATAAASAGAERSQSVPRPVSSSSTAASPAHAGFVVYRRSVGWIQSVAFKPFYLGERPLNSTCSGCGTLVTETSNRSNSAGYMLDCAFCERTYQSGCVGTELKMWPEDLLCCPHCSSEYHSKGLPWPLQVLEGGKCGEGRIARKAKATAANQQYDYNRPYFGVIKRNSKEWQSTITLQPFEVSMVLAASSDPRDCARAYDQYLVRRLGQDAISMGIVNFPQEATAYLQSYNQLVVDVSPSTDASTDEVRPPSTAASAAGVSGLAHSGSGDNSETDGAQAEDGYVEEECRPKKRLHQGPPSSLSTSAVIGATCSSSAFAVRRCNVGWLHGQGFKEPLGTAAEHDTTCGSCGAASESAADSSLLRCGFCERAFHSGCLGAEVQLRPEDLLCCPHCASEYHRKGLPWPLGVDSVLEAASLSRLKKMLLRKKAPGGDVECPYLGVARRGGSVYRCLLQFGSRKSSVSVCASANPRDCARAYDQYLLRRFGQAAIDEGVVNLPDEAAAYLASHQQQQLTAEGTVGAGTSAATAEPEPLLFSSAPPLGAAAAVSTAVDEAGDVADDGFGAAGRAEGMPGEDSLSLGGSGSIV